MSVCPRQIKDRCFSGGSTAAKRKVSAGFTLIELMISLILMALLINLVIPVGGLTVNSRLDYVHQRFYSSALLARSEAIKRSANVSLCQSDSGTACNNKTDWANGWVIFVNPNNDNVIDSGEDIIQVYDEFTIPVEIEWSNGNHLTFVPRGSSDTAGNFTVCPDPSGSADPRQVIVFGTGQVSKSTGTGSC